MSWFNFHPSKKDEALEKKWRKNRGKDITIIRKKESDCDFDERKEDSEIKAEK